jgi:hypothetical protein
MAPPPPAATATAAPTRRHAGTSTPSRRWTPLRSVPSRKGRTTQRRPTRSRRLLSVVSVSMVVAALLAVVVAQAFLTNGQVRLSTLQHDLALEQSSHRQAELAVAELETPSRIVGAATNGLHMVHPSVTELPYVSLTAPLPTPNVTAAPATAPSTSSTSSTASTSSTTTPTSTP